MFPIVSGVLLTLVVRLELVVADHWQKGRDASSFGQTLDRLRDTTSLLSRYKKSFGQENPALRFFLPFCNYALCISYPSRWPTRAPWSEGTALVPI